MLSYFHDFLQWFLLKATEPLEKPTLQLSTQWTGCWPGFASCSFWDFSVSGGSKETRSSFLVSFLLHQSHRWTLCFHGNRATWRVVKGTDEKCEILLRRAGRWTVNTNKRQTKLRFPFCSILFCMFVLILMRWQWEASLCFCSQTRVQQPELYPQTLSKKNILERQIQIRKPTKLPVLL